MWLKRSSFVLKPTIVCRYPKRSLSTKINDADYCREIIKNQDYESYLIGLLLPYRVQPAFFAIRAFNAEISTIRDHIPRNSVNAGRLRFQYWRDILHQIEEKQYKPQANQPVINELSKYVDEYQLSVRLLERNLEARYTDMINNGRCETYDDLETYAETAHASLNYLTLELFGIKDSPEYQYIASHVGVAMGITTLLRGYAHHASLGSCYIPKEVRQKFKLPDNVAISGPKSPEDEKVLHDAIYDVCCQAYAHLDKARLLYKDLPQKSPAIYAYLPGIVADHWLDVFNKTNFNPYQAAAELQQTSPLLIQLKLAKGSWTRTF